MLFRKLEDRKEIMSNLKFGTSGIRGLVTEFTFEECYRFTAAFAESIRSRGFRKILVAGDLRESTPEIKEKVVRALHHLGFDVLDGGTVPTPALAWGCALLSVPGVMITGSHIPADRNGLKYYLPEGEILKTDEEAILKSYNDGKERALDLSQNPTASAIESVDLAKLFSERYLNAFPGAPLAGIRVGFYSHSSVARDLYPEIFKKMGAEVCEFGRSNHFIPVDTEAVESVQFLFDTLREKQLHLVVSTDGDADRPLVVTNEGRVIPGEILGLIASKFLGIETIAYPVSCSSALQASKWIDDCSITRIGSPFVLGRMLEKLSAQPNRKVAGFEANGGYLLGSEAKGLKPLMTRDSLLPILCLLLSMKEQGAVHASDLMKPFSKYVNLSGLIKSFSLENAAKTLTRFKEVLSQDAAFDCPVKLGALSTVNELDGVRAQFSEGATVHLRPSGNAPEFRLYVEAGTRENAEAILKYFEGWVRAQA
jgi:phosphomannomutase